MTLHWSNAYQPRIEFYKSIIGSRHSSARAPSNALDTIRKESSIIKAQHALLNECQNALLPVSRLAPETLSHVFHFLAGDLPLVPDKAERLDYTYSPLLKSWTKVLYVSRHFRRTALNDPSLWPAITTALGREWMDKLVDLSGSTFVTFHVGSRTRVMELAVRSALLKVVGRTRDLQITTDSKGLYALEILALEIPFLEKVRFHMSEFNEADSASDDEQDMVPEWNSDVLVRASMPVLQELSIHGFGVFPWSSDLLQPTLTVLHIGTYSGQFDDNIVQLPPLESLLAAFSRLPHLAELSLERCQISPPSPGITPVAMLNLRKFCIDDCDYMTMAIIFTNLHTPPQAKLQFFTDISRFNYPRDQLSIHHVHDDISPSFFETLTRHLASPAWQDVRTVEFMIRPEDCPEMYPAEERGLGYYAASPTQTLVINAWRMDDSRIVCADCDRVPRTHWDLNNYDPPTEYVRYVRPEPDLSIALDIGARHPFRFIDECLGLFTNSPSVYTLSLRFDHDALPLGNWHQSLEGYASVKFLRADGMLGQNILERLYTLGINYRRAAPSSSPRTQPLPELKVVALLRDGGDVKWRSRPAVDGCKDRLQLLAKMWELRLENGVPLQEVILDERRCALPHFESICKAIKIRPIHLWNFRYPDTIMSEHEEDSDEYY